MDYGHAETDKELKALEEKVRKEYERAATDMNKKASDYLDKYKKKDDAKKRQLEKGEITKQEYQRWRVGQLAIGKRWDEMRDTLYQDLNNAHNIAKSMTTEFTYDVYALNHNYGTFEVESGSLMDTSYTLYDRDSVYTLIKDQPKLLPKWDESRQAIARDKRWDLAKFDSAITQGILQGESMKGIAKRLSSVANMKRGQDIRIARTMTTSAENLGRKHSYERASSMGINVKNQWIATLDSRTRDSHRMIDGEVRKIDEEFSNGLMFPGDPDGEPEEVYNCRCTLIAVIDGIDYDLGDASELNGKLGDMSYDEWKYEHDYEEESMPSHIIAYGKDISGSWSRRTDQFDFEIEDVINAQGFDGLPRVVSREEFDEAVKAANDGNGFIAQRTYSAADQETVDAYRDQLYSGDWYVDCSTGGAQYGQGMYCAADYTGTLSAGIKSEMDHYQELGMDRFQNAAQNAFEESYSFDNFRRKAKLDYSEEEFQILKKERMLGDPYLLTEKERDILEDMFTNGKYAEYTRIMARESDDFIANYIKSKGISHTETMTLDPSARIITYDEIFEMKASYPDRIRERAMIDYIEEHRDVLGEEGVEFYKRLNHVDGYDFDYKRMSELHEKMSEKAQGMEYEIRQSQYSVPDSEIYKFSNMDIGSFAAMLGYDAINAVGHGASSSYTVILNRTKCIILGE